MNAPISVISLADHRPPYERMKLLQLMQLNRAGDEQARAAAFAWLDNLEAALEAEENDDE